MLNTTANLDETTRPDRGVDLQQVPSGNAPGRVVPSSGATLFDRDDESIDAKFAAFDAAHPEVYRLFVRFARELRARGCRRGSAEQIVQRIRWETAINPAHDGGWKINDHFRSRYARKLAGEFPAEFAEFFEFRTRGVA